MLKKYNIALLPATKRKKITELSQGFVDIADQYLLGEKSLPHVTLCQFLAEESNIDRIWSEVSRNLHRHSIELVFGKSESITIDRHRWIFLLPNTSSDLIEMHYVVANTVKSPMNRSFDKYYPHVTLINIKKDQKEQKDSDLIKNLYPTLPIKDTFNVALGECDTMGQFTKVIYEYDANLRITTNL